VADTYDDNEQLQALKRWWDDYGTYLLIGLVVVLGSFFGWQFWQNQQQSRAEAASMLFEQFLEARQEPLELRVVEAEAALAELDSSHQGSSYQVFSLFFRAQDAVSREAYEDAAAYLQRAVDGARAAELRNVARLRLARVQQQLGDSDAALATLRAVTGSGFRAQAAEIQGDILVARDDRAAAREAYERALELAGDSMDTSLLQLKLADLASDA
jgi:predicted negative regulator of RcsB-dependent stress response